MNRLEFVKQLGTGALAICAGCSLINCAGNDPAPSSPTSGTAVDFTLNIDQSPNTVLQVVGGSLIHDNIIIARTGASTFVALSKGCTHQGSTINYVHLELLFRCPNHGSEFSTIGDVLKGPALNPLKKYNTEFTSPNLRIFS